MDNMKKLLFSAIGLLLAVMLIGQYVPAADTATVTATVTVQNISVSVVSDGIVNYGTMPVNSWKSTLPGELNDMQTVRNDGNVPENFNIKGQNSNNWTLAGTPGNEAYTHQFCNDTDLDCSNPPTNYTALTTGYQTLDTNIAVNGTVDFQLRLGTPTNTVHYTPQSVDVTIQAVASGG